MGCFQTIFFGLQTKRKKNIIPVSVYITYMQWTLRNVYTFHHLVDSYRNAISKWAMRFRDGNFNLKLARGKKSLASRGLIFGGEEISIPETQPIRKSYIC